MTVQDLANHAIGSVERLPYPAALDLVKRAWERVRSETNWNWLVRAGQFQIPEAITIGTVAVTQFSATITFNAAAITALNASVTATSIPIAGRAFRATINLVGTPYIIKAYDSGTGVATLDRSYRDADAAAANFSVFKPFHTPPLGADFVRFRTPTDVTEGYPLATDFTREELDRADPQRSAEGNPYRIAYWGIDPVSGSLPLFELWPYPTTAKVIDLQVVTKGLTDWSPSLRTFPAAQFVFPPSLNDDILKQALQSLAYRWAEAHKGKYDELKGITWRFMWQQADEDYARELKKALRQDRENSPKIIPPPGSRALQSPIDAAFWQSHDVI
jgi:hypothetical protein